MTTDYQTIGQIAAEQARRIAEGKPPLKEIRWNDALAAQLSGLTDAAPDTLLGIPVRKDTQ